MNTKKRQRVKSRILTDTPEKQAIEMAHEERKHKQQGEKKSNIKDKVKLMKKQTKKKITVYSSSDESNVPIPLDDISEYESSKDDSSLLVTL